MKSLLTHLKPSFPPAAVMMESSTLFALRIGGKKGEALPIFRHQEPLGEGFDGPLPEAAVLKSLVESLLTRMGAPRRLSLLLGDPFFTIKVLTLTDFPRSDEERKRVILWHLRKNLGESGEELRLSYQLLKKTPRGVSLLVTTIPRKTILEIEEVFAAGNCRIGYVAPVSAALYNFVIAVKGLGEEGSALLLNRTPEYVSFLFVDKGTPLFFRCKTLHGDDRGEDAVHRISRELRLTLKYYEEKLGGEPLGKILVRRWPEGVDLPVKEVAGEETLVKKLEDMFGELAGGERRGADYLPLFAITEGSP